MVSSEQTRGRRLQEAEGLTEYKENRVPSFFFSWGVGDMVGCGGGFWFCFRTVMAISIATGSQEGLWSLHPSIYTESDWTQFWGHLIWQTLLWAGESNQTLQRCFSTLTIPQFFDANQNNSNRKLFIPILYMSSLHFQQITQKTSCCLGFFNRFAGISMLSLDCWLW